MPEAAVFGISAIDFEANYQGAGCGVSLGSDVIACEVMDSAGGSGHRFTDAEFAVGIELSRA